jgi:hypothetical protein
MEQNFKYSIKNHSTIDFEKIQEDVVSFTLTDSDQNVLTDLPSIRMLLDNKIYNIDLSTNTFTINLDDITQTVQALSSNTRTELTDTLNVKYLVRLLSKITFSLDTGHTPQMLHYNDETSEISFYLTEKVDVGTIIVDNILQLNDYVKESFTEEE